LFSEYSINKNFSFRIFRVALLFICQGSSFLIACLVCDSLFSLSQLSASVKHFFIFLIFLIGKDFMNRLFISATKIILPRHSSSVNNYFQFFSTIFSTLILVCLKRSMRAISKPSPRDDARVLYCHIL